jgi:hypothetical protein
MKRQSGQSMTEFAAGSALLVLLLLGALSLGGYQEVDRRIVIAARQSAWQQSWLPAADSAALARQLHDAHLADAGVRDPAGRTRLVAGEDLALTTSQRSTSGVAGAAADLMLAPLRTASSFLGSGFDLRDDGLQQGNLRAHIAPLRGMPAPFDTLELDLNASWALLGDAWHAGSTRHVRQRAGGLVPSARLTAVNAIWQPLAVPLGLVEPSLGQLCLGLIEGDRVPEDRLGPGSTPLPGGCP